MFICRTNEQTARAYWQEDHNLLATHIMVVSPSEALFKKAADWITEVHDYRAGYDMDVSIGSSGFL